MADSKDTVLSFEVVNTKRGRRFLWTYVDVFNKAHEFTTYSLHAPYFAVYEKIVIETTNGSEVTSGRIHSVGTHGETVCFDGLEPQFFGNYPTELQASEMEVGWKINVYPQPSREEKTSRFFMRKYGVGMMGLAFNSEDPLYEKEGDS